MNQVKFSKKTLLAVGISTAILSGCGGGGDDATPSPSTTFSMTAIDGYLVGAEIWADQNSDGVCEVDTGEITTAGGQAEISNDFRDVVLCVKAIEGTVDEDRGIIEQAYQLKAPAGSDVVTPITDLVVTAAIEKKTVDPSLSLTEAVTEAKQEVIEALTETTDSSGDSVFDETELFSDYIKSANKKLTVIGEVLADNAATDDSANLEDKLDLAKKVTSAIADKTNEDLEGKAPTINEDGTVDLISPPRLVTANVSKEYEKGIEFPELDLSQYFAVDSENVTYSFLPLNDLALNAELDEDNFDKDTGKLKDFPTDLKGTFKFQAFATDNDHSVRSKPLPVTITINFEDDLPVVVEDNVTLLQDALDSLQDNETIRQGEGFDSQEFSISELFKDDGKSEVTYQVKGTIPGIALSINDSDQLVISTKDTAGKAGTYSFTVEASDENNAEWASAKFTLVILDSPEPVVHPLEGQIFYKIEADAKNQEVYCQSLKFEDNTIWFIDDNEDTQTIDPLKQCAEPTINIGTYTTDGETLTGNITGENPFTLSVNVVDEDPIVKGESTRYVVNLVDKLPGGDESSTQIFYTGKADAERHLDAGGNYAEYSYYYPTEAEYKEGAIHVQLKKDPQSETDAFDADLYFDTFEAGWTCEDALQNFGTFALYERDINSNANTVVAISTECYDITDNNGIDEQGLVVIDFDFSQSQALTEGNRYSFVAIHGDNNDIASFGASFIYQDTSVAACNSFDSAWDDTNDRPAELADFNKFAYGNAIEACGHNFEDSIADLFNEQHNGEAITSIKLRRIDLNPNETEYIQLYATGNNGLNAYIALDGGVTVNATWNRNDDATLELNAVKANIKPEDNDFSDNFEARELLAITDYDEHTGHLAVKGFTQNTDWDSLGLGTKANGYGSIFSGVYEVTFNEH